MPRPRSERRSPWPAVVLAVGLPILYVLSIGPVASIGGAVDWQNRLGAVYAPVCLCVRAWPALADPINGYIDACDINGYRMWIDPEYGVVTAIDPSYYQ